MDGKVNRMDNFDFVTFTHMRPDITIEDVNLQLDTSRKYIEAKAHVIITFKNNSKTLTYYVLKQPSMIDYDKSSRTLSIGLYEPPQPPQQPNASTEPELVAILPDTTTQWQHLLSVWMKKITRRPGLREMVEVLDISDVQNVVCTVACRVDSSSTWCEPVSAGFQRRLT